MKVAFAFLIGCSASMASAQITSITDPSAYQPDRPTPKAAPAQRNAVPTSEKLDAPDISVPVEGSSAKQPGQSQDTQVSALNLVCGGSGTANKPNVATIYGSSNTSGMVGSAPISMSGNHSGSIVTQRQQDYADQVDVRLFSGDDRIRLPRTLLPPIHGGSDGWFELTNVKVTDRTITASAGINFMNHPKVHIDRLTGTISINGKAGSYTGQCEAVDPNAQRKF